MSNMNEEGDENRSPDESYYSEPEGEQQPVTEQIDDYEYGDVPPSPSSPQNGEGMYQTEGNNEDLEEEKSFLANSLRHINRVKLNSRSRLSVQVVDGGWKGFEEEKKRVENEILSKPVRTTMTTHVIIPLDSLPKHKTATEFVCPQFEVEKFNPRTRIKLLSKTRIFEVNLAEQRFSNLKKGDLVEQKSFKFEDIVDFEEMDPNKDSVLGITFKGKKLPRRLKFKTRSEMLQFNELCKLAQPGNVVWVPGFVEENDSAGLVKKIELQGEISLKKNIGGEVVTEQVTVGGADFQVGSQYENVQVYCATWNLGVCSLPSEDDLAKFVEKAVRFEEEGENVDLYVICLQQKLSIRHPMSQKDADSFDSFFTGKGFSKVCAEVTPGVAIFAFVKEALKGRITRVCTSKKASKSLFSSATLEMYYNESPIAIVGLTVLPKIFDKKSQALLELFDDDKLEGSHHLFLLGDFNTTVALPPSIALSFINKREDLGGVVVGFDQLKILQDRHGKLQYFKEGDISFLPTYPVRYHTYTSLAAAEKSTNIKQKLNYQYIEGKDLSYSSRVLVRSLQGIHSEVNEYESTDVVSGRYRHLPVYSKIQLYTQRCHISHFEPPEPRKVLTFMGMYVGGICTIPDMKDPQLRIEGEWLEKNVVSKRAKGRPTANPKFMRSELPIMRFVKDSKSFLSSVRLKLVLFDKSLPKSHCVKGTAVLDLKNLVEEAVEGRRVNGTWFACPIMLGTANMGEMIGYVAMMETSDEPEKEEVEGELDEDNVEIKDVVKGFEGI